MRKHVLVVLLTFILASVVSGTFWVEAGGTIYIRADGSVDPPTAPIQRDGDIYTFSGNIYDSIVVERDNIVVDGAGYTVQGAGSETGIELSHRNNVTIKNTQITDFSDNAIFLNSSSENTITGNNVPFNADGIELVYSNNNIITGNIASSNIDEGIDLEDSNNNTIAGNNVSNNNLGIYMRNSNNNTITGNNVSNNNLGIYMRNSNNNTITGNNFIDNIVQAYIETGEGNIWNNGYPSGGNYWSDYWDRYPTATEKDGSGMWDTPYEIDENNRDDNPFVEVIPEFPSSLLFLPIFVITTLIVIIANRRKR